MFDVFSAKKSTHRVFPACDRWYVHHESWSICYRVNLQNKNCNKVILAYEVAYKDAY